MSLVCKNSEKFQQLSSLSLSPGARRNDIHSSNEVNERLHSRLQSPTVSRIADLRLTPSTGESRFRLRSIQFERSELQILTDCPRAYYRTLPARNIGRNCCFTRLDSLYAMIFRRARFTEANRVIFPIISPRERVLSSTRELI